MPLLFLLSNIARISNYLQNRFGLWKNRSFGVERNSNSFGGLLLKRETIDFIIEASFGIQKITKGPTNSKRQMSYNDERYVEWRSEHEKIECRNRRR